MSDGIREITADELASDLEGGDGLVNRHEHWGGIYVGQNLPRSGAVVKYIFSHHESGCAWCIVFHEGVLKNVSLDYEAGMDDCS